MKPRESLGERVRKEIYPGLWLDSELALVFSSESTLVISDIHWGYAAVHRHHGNLFPVWGDSEIAARLTTLLNFYRPRRMVWLGDFIHGEAGQRAAEAYLDQLPGDLEVILIGGNHDRSWTRTLLPEFRLGDYLLHHGDLPREIPEGVCEIVGHWHPAMTHRDGAGLSLKLPVLVQQGKRLVVPAFSPWSRGTNWEGETGDILWIAAPKRIWKKGPVLPPVA